VTFVAVYDANVLYPSTLRDVLIRIALGGLVQAKWTEEILEETFRNLAKNRPDLGAWKLARTRQLLRTVVSNSMVAGYEELIPAISLTNDPNDRHMVAAAIKSGAQVIVTFNVKDFPAWELEKWGIEAKHPDDFLVDQFYLNGPAVHRAIQAIADAWANPPGTAEDVLNSLERDGLPQITALLRR